MLLVVVFVFLAMSLNMPPFSSNGKLMNPPPYKMVPQKLVLNLVPSSSANRSFPQTETVSPEPTIPNPSSANRSFPQTETVSQEPTMLMNSNKRYVLSESYWEELTMATWNFMGLVKIAGSWGARAVLPFTAGSLLNGINAKYSLDLIYDLDDIKRVCNKLHSLPMPVKFEEFLSDAS